MSTLYKLTTRDWKSRAGSWGPGVTHTASGVGSLCGPGWIHAYTHPLLAVLLDPIFGHVGNPVLWRCEGEIGKSDHELQVGTRSLTTVEVVDLPVVTIEQRVVFALLCACRVYRDANFVAWAEAWMSGADRSAAAARAAQDAAWDAQDARQPPAPVAESAAAMAAAAAEWSIDAGNVGEAGWLARDVARAAAQTAAWSVCDVAGSNIDLVAVAKKAISEEVRRDYHP